MIATAETTIEIEVYCEPAQRGGLHTPSYPAEEELETITIGGKLFPLDFLTAEGREWLVKNGRKWE